MIFSVQNSNLIRLVVFSPDLVQIQMRETVSGVFLTHGRSDAKRFQQTSYDEITHGREPT